MNMVELSNSLRDYVKKLKVWVSNWICYGWAYDLRPILSPRYVVIFLSNIHLLSIAWKCFTVNIHSIHLCMYLLGEYGIQEYTERFTAY